MRLAEYCALLDERAPLANRLTKRTIAHATAIELATVEDPRAIREVLDALAFSTEAVDRAPPPRLSGDATPPAAVCA